MASCGCGDVRFLVKSREKGYVTRAIIQLETASMPVGLEEYIPAAVASEKAIFSNINL
jgi:hypothetical protein